MRSPIFPDVAIELRIYVWHFTFLAFMRIPTLAACALAVLATQDWNQQANASQTTLPADTESTISDTASLEEPVVSDEREAIAPPEVLSEAQALQPIRSTSTTVAVEPDSEPGIAIPVVPTQPPLPTAPARPDAQPNERTLIPPQPNLTPISPVDRVSPPQNSSVTAQQPQYTTTSTRIQIEGQELPAPGVLPKDFTFPIQVEVVTDAAIATDTPITDRAYPTFSPRTTVGTLEELARYREARTAAINVWGEQVRGCLSESPRLVSLKPDGQSTLVLFNGNPGRIVRNVNGRLVCPV